ncbi:MAG: hypothetical protein IT370_24810 [Deltaproteobacteria bacterium]|nr:hypothetical protein [Deltaproteobacteria bacterium]
MVTMNLRVVALALLALPAGLQAQTLGDAPSAGDPTMAPSAEPEAAPGPTMSATGVVDAEARVSASATAAPPRTGFAIGIAPRVGVTVPTSKLGVFVVGGLEIDLFLPVLRGRLVVALDATLTRPSHDGTGNDARVGGDYDFTVEETEFKLGLDVIYRLAGRERKLVPFVGAGPIVHLLKSVQTNSLGPESNTEQSTAYGVEVLGGADYRLGPGALVGDLRLVYSGLDHLLTGDTNAANLTASVGYRMIF